MSHFSRFILPVVGIIFIGISAYAQGQDFMVLQSGDSLTGRVRWQSYSSARFKPTSTGKGVKYKVDQIDHYYIGSRDRYYYSKQITFGKRQMNRLVRQTVRGKICVYTYVVSTGKSVATYYFMEKDNSGLVPLNGSWRPKKETKSKVKEFIKENPQMMNQLDADKKNTKTLLRYIQLYNSWYARNE